MWVWRTQQPLWIPSSDWETRFPISAQMARERGLRSACWLPLTTSLPNGGFLLAGGGPNSRGIASQVFDPTTQSFVSVGNLRINHSGDSQVTLGDGRVLLTGGNVPALAAATPPSG